MNLHRINAKHKFNQQRCTGTHKSAACSDTYNTYMSINITLA